MPSRPGVLPVMAHAQAGTVMGGVMLARSPCIPPSMSLRMFGISSARSRNSSGGVPQSRPLTATRGPWVIGVVPLVVGFLTKRSVALEGRAPEAASLYPLVRTADRARCPATGAPTAGVPGDVGFLDRSDREQAKEEMWARNRNSAAP